MLLRIASVCDYVNGDGVRVGCRREKESGPI